MNNEVVKKAFANKGKFNVLNESRYINLNDTRQEFGVIQVLSGSVQLFTYKDTPNVTAKLIKTYRLGDIILVDLLRLKSYEKNYVLVAGKGGSRLISMSYDKFKDVVYKGNKLFQDIIESWAECPSLLINKQVPPRKLSAEDKYIAALYKTIENESGKIAEIINLKPEYITIKCGRGEIAAITGLGERTVRRAHMSLTEKGVLKTTPLRNTVIANRSELFKIVEDKNLKRLALQ